MEKIFVLLICLMLCACSNIGDVNSQLESVFNKDLTFNHRINNYTNYIEYFVPSDVNEQEVGPLSFSFDGDGFGFIMNINVTSIINKEYYNNLSLNDEGFFDENKLIYNRTGSFNNIDNKIVDYFIKTYQYDDECLVYFVTNELNFYGHAKEDKVGLLVNKIIQMTGTCVVNNDKVLEDFSSINVIDYEKKAVNLFESIYPVEGRIEDLMVDSDSKVPE